MLRIATNPALTERERIPTVVFSDPQEMNRAVAAEIAALIREKQAAGETCVLGLATGSHPVGGYNKLGRMHKEEGLSFRNVVTFNLDEYFPMQPMEVQSYHRFMNEHLFDHIDIPPQNVHIPDGTLAPEQVQDYCQRYEEQIVA